MNRLILLAVISSLLSFFSCGNNPSARIMATTQFDTTVNGQSISLFTLTNKNGAIAQITNYGGRVVALWVTDRDGEFRDVVLGFDSISNYLLPSSGNQGAVVGRYANRIENRQFTLDSTQYLLMGNPDVIIDTIGVADFNRAIFIPRAFLNEKNEQALELTYHSPDGEAGFPGNVDVTVTYTLSNDNELKIDYKAVTDKPTVVSLTNHSFFNLRGEGVDDISDYELYVNADYYLPIKEGTIPTGEIASVEGTPLDFRTPQKIGEHIDADFEALLIDDGYDQCFVLNIKDGELTHVASMYDPVSGIVMDVATTQPGMQLYTANKLNGIKGKDGKPYVRRSAACLETMHFPDSPNHDNFPTTTLRPGEVYEHSCIYKFSTK